MTLTKDEALLAANALERSGIGGACGAIRRSRGLLKPSEAVAQELSDAVGGESPQGFGHALNSWSLSDWMTATLGEIGEAANIAKKLNRCRDGIPGNRETFPELCAGFADELADTFIYLDLLAQSQGIDLAQAVASKFNRTSEKIGSEIRIEI